MTQLASAPEMQTGVDALDALHRDIFETMVGLTAATDKGFSHCYGSLVAKVERVFATEEEWMEAIGFGDLKCHREQHARVLGALHVVHSQVLEGNVSLGRKVVERLLPQWLVMHIPAMDVSMAHALRKAGIAGVATPAEKSSPVAYAG